MNQYLFFILKLFKINPTLKTSKFLRQPQPDCIVQKTKNKIYLNPKQNKPTIPPNMDTKKLKPKLFNIKIKPIDKNIKIKKH